MFAPDWISQAENLLGILRARSLKLATAESCTGGLISALFTEIPGSSDAYERGFVTYSNAAKIASLGVDYGVLQRHGAVSAEVAAAMAAGALRASAADISIAVTGVAGPSGGSPAKPVGLVYIGLATQDGARSWEYRFGDIGRTAVRAASVVEALALLHRELTD